MRSPRDQGLAWDRFWAGIQRTGPDGEVLWDAASTDELTHAVKLAAEGSSDMDNVTYRALDASVAGAGQQLLEELGEANVFIRGVFHVFDTEQRERAVANIRDMIGQHGVVYFAETDYAGDPLDQWSLRGRPLRPCLSRSGSASLRASSHPGTSVKLS